MRRRVAVVAVLVVAGFAAVGCRGPGGVGGDRGEQVAQSDGYPSDRLVGFAGGRGGNGGQANGRVGDPDTDDNTGRANLRDRSNQVDPPVPTNGSRQDMGSAWRTNPAAGASAALGPDRAGHQSESLHRPESSKPGGLPVARTPSLEQSPSANDRSPDYGQIVLGSLAGATITVAVTGTLGQRRRRRSRLDAALGSVDPDDLPRAAGLLGDLFAQQHRTGAAEHAYRAAIEVGHPYWSPIAQVALAQVLSDRGERAEARALLEAATATGHPRAVSVAQTHPGHPALGRSSETSTPLKCAEWVADA